jgi:hypothetical protein
VIRGLVALFHPATWRRHGNTWLRGFAMTQKDKNAVTALINRIRAGETDAITELLLL